MAEHDTAPLDGLLEVIEREPPRRRAFWIPLVEQLRRRHARLPVPVPAHALRRDGDRMPAHAVPTRRRFRGLRLLLLIVGLLGAPFQLTTGRPPR
jgi:hypothetical protein